MKLWVSDLKDHVGKTVSLKGWVYNLRSSGKLYFIILRDGTGYCQCVFYKPDLSDEVLKSCEALTQEAAVEITGLVKEEKRSPGGYELQATDLKILSSSENYPITPKEHGVDYLMNHRHLWLRSKKQHAILRVRSRLVRAIRDFFDNKNFTLTDAPIFTPNAAEGTTTLFKTQYFDESTYLSQSGQLYLEATAAALGKTYCFGPTFRAEKSKTRRHLIEFWMVEAEVAFNDLYDNMDLAEEFVAEIVGRVVRESEEELKVLERDVTKLEKVKAPFQKLHYKEATEIIKKENPEFQVGGDLGAQDETLLSEKFDTPVFVHHFPTAIKAFYMKEDEKEPEYSMSFDLIATEGYGEIIGAGQREDQEDILLKKIKEHDLEVEHFQWYLDLRRYGSVPHSGFGLGVERTLAWICGLKHVRETIPFPRMYGRHHP